MTKSRLHERRTCRAGTGEASEYFLLSLLAMVSFFSMTRALSAQSQESSSMAPVTLPASCRSLGKSDRRVGERLAEVPRHATAEAYHALGAAYAEANKLNCAVPAFEEALRLDEQDWRARYNPAL